jgi:uncharacterized membrane protein SpoIIM required for sporulation
VKQEVFVRQRETRWQQLEAILNGLDRREPTHPGEFPRLYRQLCQDLALARDRQFTEGLIDRLNRLALRGYRWLYEAQPAGRWRVLEFLESGFPRAVRAEWRLFLLLTVLFYGSGLVMLLLGRLNPDLIYSLIDPSMVASIESMYDPASRAAEAERGLDSDVMMFGFYIMNNISIAFRTFAGGILFGVGSLVIIIFNGLFLGLVDGHMIAKDMTSTFYPFVIGHSSFELTAIVLAGVAGMRLGLALVAPGAHSRGQALRDAALGTMPILYGMTGMLVIAAFIEAFWSSSRAIPDTVKYAVGTLFWILLFTYLLLGGRRRAA